MVWAHKRISIFILNPLNSHIRQFENRFNCQTANNSLVYIIYCVWLTKVVLFWCPVVMTIACWYHWWAEGRTRSATSVFLQHPVLQTTKVTMFRAGGFWCSPGTGTGSGAGCVPGGRARWTGSDVGPAPRRVHVTVEEEIIDDDD